MFSLSTWIWLIERNDLVDFVPNGYDRILLALTPQRPNIDFGLFIRPFTVQGGFQLLDLIIMELKSHMTCYNSMPLIG